LLWDNIAIWYDIFGLFNHFAEKGVVFPVDTYTSAWTGNIDPARPVAEGLAHAYSSIYLNQDLQSKLAIMTQMMHRYQLDGFVLHANRSCKPYTSGQQLIHKHLSETTGKPGLLLEADMVDSRHYDRQRLASQIDTYLEVLA
jgi:benzoyl-CoA reductase/2-hydroxyglutaryl-CoA dehydratase subunit BcrC/BadD/HgdB